MFRKDKTKEELVLDAKTHYETSERLRRENRKERETFAKVLAEKDELINQKDAELSYYQGRNIEQNEVRMAQDARIKELKDMGKEDLSIHGRGLRRKSLILNKE